MTQAPFVSYAQNAEDVVLWRALGHVSGGRYVQVSAGNPPVDSVTRAFDERGWSGIAVEAMPGLADVLERHGANDQDIHFMLVDVEGVHPDVLQTVDLRRWRPWVLVLQSKSPNSTAFREGDWDRELLAYGYEYCLFDGLSRFYLAAEKADPLRAALSYPACVMDDYQALSYTIVLKESQELLEQVSHWRTIALTRWADALSQGLGRSPNSDTDAELEQARRQFAAIQRTLSWRVTRPLRGVRRVISRARRR